MVALISEPAGNGQVFNIGNGPQITIGALAAKVTAVTGSRSKLVCVPCDRADEAGCEDRPRHLPDTSEIAALVGYRPTVVLDKILTRVIEFHRIR